ncbi:uncharacterized protein KQ657_003780 [Scheffersomyces spartinae]|uniref:Uncharacterized protein n=1 Tax=Scheffersomyces spartinae TaxID=45513 RepID=A0A9P8AJV3_9ASCO|nr:uncharacterized protein KQ657_003780 [Scheffersomyces spartinae]KAG7195254.1 hypothetical protein KQ657_003780 [Scheffersomyces spartinae]
MDTTTTDSEGETIPTDDIGLASEFVDNDIDIDFASASQDSNNNLMLPSFRVLDVALRVNRDRHRSFLSSVHRMSTNDGADEADNDDVDDDDVDGDDDDEDTAAAADDEDGIDEDEDEDYDANDDSMVDEYFSQLLGGSETLRSDNPLNEHLLLSSSSQNFTRRNAIISSDRRERQRNANYTPQQGAISLSRQYTIRCKRGERDTKVLKDDKLEKEISQIADKIDEIFDSLKNLAYKPRLSPLFPIPTSPQSMPSYLTTSKVMKKQGCLSTSMDNILQMRRNGSWWNFQKYNSSRRVKSRKRKSTSFLSRVTNSRSSFLDVRLAYHDQSVHIQLPPLKRKRTNEESKSRTTTTGSTDEEHKKSKLKDSKQQIYDLNWQTNLHPSFQNGPGPGPIGGKEEEDNDVTLPILEKEIDVSSFFGEQCADNMLSSEDKEMIMNIIPNSHLKDGTSFCIGIPGSGTDFCDLNVQIVDYDQKTLEGTFEIQLDSIKKLIQIRRFFFGNQVLDSISTELSIFDRMTGAAEQSLFIDKTINYLIAVPFHGNLVDFKKNDLRFYEGNDFRSLDSSDSYVSRAQCYLLRAQLMEWTKLNPFKQFKELYFLLVLWRLKCGLCDNPRINLSSCGLKRQALEFAEKVIKYIEPLTNTFGFAKHQSPKRKISFYDESKEMMETIAASQRLQERERANDIGGGDDINLLDSVLNDGTTEVFMRGRNNRHAFILRDPPPQVTFSNYLSNSDMSFFMETWNKMMADVLGDTLTMPNNCLTNIQWNYILFDLTVDAGDILDHLIQIVIASFPESVIEKYRNEESTENSLPKKATSCPIMLVGSIDRKSGKLELTNTIKSMKSRFTKAKVPNFPLPPTVINPPIKPISRLVFSSSNGTNDVKDDPSNTINTETVLTGFRKHNGTRGGGMSVTGIL